MKNLLRLGIRILPLCVFGGLAGCASMSGMQERLAACTYEHAWEAAVEAVRDRSIDTTNKATGLLVTHWLEIPMPGRQYGIFRRDVADSRDRSRLTLRVRQVDSTSTISFIEERQSWGFRGGSRLFGWIPTEPSEEVMRDVQKRIDTKLQEQGCAVT
ncbi:MAG: hypothetical protein IPM58_16145 [Nitrospira sp.]|nr:hypothetical protein [Nitrospira sp.]